MVAFECELLFGRGFMKIWTSTHPSTPTFGHVYTEECECTPTINPHCSRYMTLTQLWRTLSPICQWPFRGLSATLEQFSHLLKYFFHKTLSATKIECVTSAVAALATGEKDGRNPDHANIPSIIPTPRSMAWSLHVRLGSCIQLTRIKQMLINQTEKNSVQNYHRQHRN